MDAKEFIRQFHRMCQSFHGCRGCPFDIPDSVERIGCYISDMADDPGKTVETVEKWNAEHPEEE